MAICNQFKDTLDNFIDNSNLELKNQVEPINPRYYNALIFEGNLADL